MRECVCVSARTEGGGAGRRPPPSARSRPPSRRAPPVPRAPPRLAPTLRPTRNARRRPPASPPAGPPRSAPTARRTPRSRSACKAARRRIIDTEHRHSATGVQQQQSEERSPKRNAWGCQHALRRAELSLHAHAAHAPLQLAEGTCSEQALRSWQESTGTLAPGRAGVLHGPVHELEALDVVRRRVGLARAPQRELHDAVFDRRRLGQHEAHGCHVATRHATAMRMARISTAGRRLAAAHSGQRPK